MVSVGQMVARRKSQKTRNFPELRSGRDDSRLAAARVGLGVGNMATRLDQQGTRVVVTVHSRQHGPHAKPKNEARCPDDLVAIWRPRFTARGALRRL